MWPGATGPQCGVSGWAEVMINERGWRGEPTCGNYRALRQRRHHIGHYRARKSSPTTCRAGRSTDRVTRWEIAITASQNGKVRVWRIRCSGVLAVTYRVI